MHHTKFRFVGQSALRGNNFQKSTNQKQQLPVTAMFVKNGSGRNEQSLQRAFYRCILPGFGSLDKTLSEENIFRNRPIRKENCLWWPCLLTNRDEMSNHNRGPSQHASFQVSVHLSQQFQRSRFFQKSTNQNTKVPVTAMFVNRSGEMSNHYRGPSINVSYQVLVYWTKRFQSKFLEIDQSETRIACVGHVC